MCIRMDDATRDMLNYYRKAWNFQGSWPMLLRYLAAETARRDGCTVTYTFDDGQADRYPGRPQLLGTFLPPPNQEDK